MLYTFLKSLYEGLICKPVIAHWLVLHEVRENSNGKISLHLCDFSIVNGTKPPIYCSGYCISQIRVIGPFENNAVASEYLRLLKK